MKKTPIPEIVVLVSGSGSNLQALIDASLKNGEFSIAAVISNNADAYALDRAGKAGIKALCIDHRNYTTRESFDKALMQQIDSYSPALLALAGFMRILTPAFIRHYRGRALNIHPSLLPKYRGLHTHQRVLQAGDDTHGCSVHFVTEELDGGPLILQARVPVSADDTEELLAKRVLEYEHIIYPMVVNWYIQGRLTLNDDQIEFDGNRLDKPLILQDICSNDG